MNAYESMDEIAAAVKALRCEHSYPVQPPHGSFSRPGNCSECGTPYQHVRVADELREPLAALLEAINDPWSAMPDGTVLAPATAISLPGTVVAQAITGRTA